MYLKKVQQNNMNPIYKIHNLKNFVTDNFTLTPVELKDFIDFEVKRIYYITDTKGPSGAHCHLAEEEFFIIQKGNAALILDDGNGLQEIQVKKDDAVYVSNWCWHQYKDMSEDFVLLALSSTNYNPNREDYIEDYQEFQKRVKEL